MMSCNSSSRTARNFRAGRQQPIGPLMSLAISHLVANQFRPPQTHHHIRATLAATAANVCNDALSCWRDRSGLCDAKAGRMAGRYLLWSTRRHRVRYPLKSSSCRRHQDSQQLLSSDLLTNYSEIIGAKSSRKKKRKVASRREGKMAARRGTVGIVREVSAPRFPPHSHAPHCSSFRASVHATSTSAATATNYFFLLLLFQL